MTNFRFNRKITSYAKVQAFISSIIRGRSVFIKNRKIKGIEYLDIGCGPNSNKDFVSLDYSWNPQIDICWDLTKKKLPFNDETFKGVFTEHCFEHILLDDFIKNMKEIYRILKPNGTLRLIMPDGELYLDIYHKRKNGENLKMPYEEGYITPMARINGIFRNHGHQFIYDYETVKYILKDLGFVNINKEKYHSGRDNTLLIDTKHRLIESLYVEAVKGLP